MIPKRITRGKRFVSKQTEEAVYCGKLSKYASVYQVERKRNNRYEVVCSTKNETAQHIFKKICPQGFEYVNENIAKMIANEAYKVYIKFAYDNAVKLKLKGKNLSCDCKQGEPCHVDILLNFVNFL